MKITNISRGHRGINVRGNDDAHVQVSLAPGETVDADLYDAHNPVYKGWEQSGEMDFGSDLASAAAESLAKLKADAEKKPRTRRGKTDAPDADETVDNV